MSKQAYEKWYVQGLQALKDAGKQGHEAASSTLQAVSAAEVRKVVEEDTHMTERHAKQIDELLSKADGAAGGEMRNKIMEGIRAGNKQVVEAADDAEVRDASVIAAAQIALHYYMAAYGTLASNAKHLGKEEDARVLKQLTEETRQQDDKFTHLAKEFANQRAA